MLALAAEGYFALLAHRLHSTTLATLEARAEKDALIRALWAQVQGLTTTQLNAVGPDVLALNQPPPP